MMRNLALASVLTLGLCVSACQRNDNAATTDTAAPAANATATASAPATAETSREVMEQVIARHVDNVKAGNADGVMVDYADEAILVTPPGMMDPKGTFVGKNNVRKFFDWLAGPEILPGAKTMTYTTDAVGPNTLLFHWTQFPGTPKEVKGYDVFVFRDGKIVYQMTAPNLA